MFSDSMEICLSLGKATLFKEKILLLEQLEAHLKTVDTVFLNGASLENEDALKVIEILTLPGLVADSVEVEERDYDESDFPDIANAAEKSFQCLKHLLPRLNLETSHPRSHKSFFLPILKLCATHSEKYMWSNGNVVSLSHEILCQLLEATKCSGLGDLLCSGEDDHPNDLFKGIFLSMRSSLTKQAWTLNPCTCHIFQWFLLNVKHPYLSHHLSDVFPPSLMFIDHHTMEKKVLGLKCVQHIIDNVPSTELKMYGRADVIYDVLYKLVYLNEPDIINVLYPCLLTFLSGQERNPHNADVPREWGRYDDVFQQIIRNMQMEERVILRRAYSVHISPFIEKMGITILRHLKSTVPVLLKYLVVYDGPEEESRINALLALKSLIKVAWPRMGNYVEECTKYLMYLIYDVESGNATNDDKVKLQILELSKEDLFLLKVACPNQFQELTADFGELENIPGIDILKSVINHTD